MPKNILKRGNNKGIVLLISLAVTSIILVLTGAYFSNLATEKRAADTEKYVAQALFLAEAGGNQAVSELRTRVGTNLTGTIENASQNQLSNNLYSYYTTQNPLALLSSYSNFNVASGKATFSISPLNLNTGIPGGVYFASVTVIPQALPQNPVFDAVSDGYRFYYSFSLNAQGNVTHLDNPRNIRMLNGTFNIFVRRDNFAKFALFTAHHKTKNGQSVWFTESTIFRGPVHTNERFSFANNPGPHFYGAVTQHNQQARFYNNGSSKLMDADSNPPRDVPIFDQGFERGYPEINLESSVNSNQMKAYATGGQSFSQDGIYVPNSSGQLVGGIYIRGDAQVELGKEAAGNIATYTIVQGSQRKEISADYDTHQTTVTDLTDGSSTTYQGLPDGPTGEDQGIIINVEGKITSLKGTIQKSSQVTVSAKNDIIITDNLKYEQYNSVYDNGVYAPNATGYMNNLGLVSWGEGPGDQGVRIATTAPNNLEIHGVIMSPQGTFSVDNYDQGSSRGTATLLGGMISQYYGAFGTFSSQTLLTGFGRNFVYDARMLEGITPPYFPYMSNFTSNDFGLDTKLTWEDQGV